MFFKKKLLFLILLFIFLSVSGCSNHKGGIEQYSIKIKPEGQGTVSQNPDVETYKKNTDVELTAEPKEGWKFSEWKGDLTGSENPSSIIVEKDIIIIPVFVEGNSAPVLASIGNKNTDEGTLLKFTITASDADKDNLTFSATGDLKQYFDAATGMFSWTPSHTDTGNYHLTITVSDGELRDTETITISVSDVNRPPTANDDTVSIDEDTGRVLSIIDNDTDPDKDTISLTTVNNPASGSISNNNDGTVTYNPDENYNGQDNFTYEISDGKGGTDTGTVNITVNPINDAPIANDDSNMIGMVNGPADLYVLDNDSDVENDSLTVTGIEGNPEGYVEIINETYIRYTPSIMHYADDSFYYIVSDGNSTARAKVDLLENTAPVAVDDTYDRVIQQAPTDMDVLANDRDDDGHNITIKEISSFNEPENGTASIIDSSYIKYTPDFGFTGDDNFDYVIVDELGYTSLGSVNITVIGF